MKAFDKHNQSQENFEDAIFILARSFRQMKVFMHKIMSLLKNTRNTENKIERILKEISVSGMQLDGKAHLLRDFYNMLSHAKTAQGEARNILLHFRLKENHEIIEQAFNKFRDSYHHTREAQKILKKMSKYKP